MNYRQYLLSLSSNLFYTAVTCELDVDKMIAFFDGYLEAYDNCFRGYSDIVGVAYTWVEWLEYNIKRALGKCMDTAERELGFLEVRNTMDRIKYIHKIEPQIREALDARLRKRDVTQYDNHDERRINKNFIGDFL